MAVPGCADCAESDFATWYALHQIKAECEGYRFGEPCYDSKLDHIYDLADGLIKEHEARHSAPGDRHEHAPSSDENRAAEQ